MTDKAFPGCHSASASAPLCCLRQVLPCIRGLGAARHKGAVCAPITAASLTQLQDRQPRAVGGTWPPVSPVLMRKPGRSRYERSGRRPAGRRRLLVVPGLIHSRVNARVQPWESWRQSTAGSDSRLSIRRKAQAVNRYPTSRPVESTFRLVVSFAVTVYPASWKMLSHSLGVSNFWFVK